MNIKKGTDKKIVHVTQGPNTQEKSLVNKTQGSNIQTHTLVHRTEGTNTQNNNGTDCLMDV